MRIPVTLCLLAVVSMASHPARAQGGWIGGLYQITSGQYITCCGIAGPTTTGLPEASDAFVELQIDAQANLAQMTILGADMSTVLRIPAEGSREAFTYSFTNGVIYPDYIRFEQPPSPSMPSQPYFTFFVSNSIDTLLIEGKVTAPCIGCGDIPQEFQHTNVVAVLMPTASIRVSQVQICWNSASNRTYQVQYRSPLTTNAWLNLGPPVAGNSPTNCTTDDLAPGQPQRFYRVLALP